MATHLFDRWTIALTQRPTRRTVWRLLAAGLGGGLLAARGVRPTRAMQTTCVQIGEVCDAAPCCVGECIPRMDEAPSICECAADGEECINIGTGACCSGQPCNDAGYCGVCAMPGASCNSDAECCRGSQFAALCCFDGVSLTTRCTDVSATGLCPGDNPAPTSCPAGQTLCTLTTTFCTDLASDPFNCGACGNSCGLGGVCSGGVCNPASGAAAAPSVDSDGDGLSDNDEVGIYGTDPGNPDTDFDGVPDGSEIHFGSDPLTPGAPADESGEEVAADDAVLNDQTSPSDDPNARPPDFDPNVNDKDPYVPGGAGGGSDPRIDIKDKGACAIKDACAEQPRVQEDDRQNNNPES